MARYERSSYDPPERKFSTGFPAGMVFLLMLAIGAFLLIGSAFINNSNETVAVILPAPAAANQPS